MASRFRRKGVYLALMLSAGGVLLLAWSQPWFILQLNQFVGQTQDLDITGQVACNSLVGIAMTVLAGSAVLALGAKILGRIVAVVIFLVSCLAIVAVSLALVDPLSVSSSALVKLFGINDPQALSGLVQQVTMTPWPVVALIDASVLCLLCVALFFSAAFFTQRTARFASTAERRAQRAPRGRDDAIDEWDELSTGYDPTSTS